jgi:hypothetical protein
MLRLERGGFLPLEATIIEFGFGVTNEVIAIEERETCFRNLIMSNRGKEERGDMCAQLQDMFRSVIHHTLHAPTRTTLSVRWVVVTKSTVSITNTCYGSNLQNKNSAVCS